MRAQSFKGRNRSLVMQGQLSKLGTRKGQTGGLAGIAIGLVIASIALAIGIFITASVQTNLNIDSLSANAQNQVTNVFTTTFNAYSIAVIGLIVVAAFGILAATGMLGGGGRRR